MSDAYVSIESASVLLVIASLALLGTSRIRDGIHILALQGALLALIVLLDVGEGVVVRGAAIAGATLLLKSVLFPWLLFRAQREAGVQEELDPLVGYAFSLAAGVVGLGVAVWLSHSLTLPAHTNSLALTTALFMIFAGLLVVVTRRIAIGQVFGYIILENGIALFGLTVASEEPLLIELAILLDVFVAVFVMGIAIAHINREFDHIEVDQLTTLKD